MSAALGIVALAILTAEPHVSGTAAISARTYARSPAADAPGANAGLELEPRGALALRWGTLTGSLRYAPTLLLGATALPATPVTALAHSAALRLDGSPQRGLSLSGYATARWGFPDLLSRGPDGSVVLAARPSLTGEQLEANVGVTAWTELTRRSTAGVTLGYWAGGGTTPRALQLLPWATSPYLSSHFAYSLSRRDTLRTELHLARMALSTGERATVLRAGERWRRDLTRSLRGELVVGAGTALLDDDPRVATASPWLGAALAHAGRLGLRELRTRADVEVLPVASRYTARVYPRAQLLTAAELDLADRISLEARGGAALALAPERRDEDLFLGDLRLRWQATPELAAEAAATARREGVPGVGPTWHWAVTAGLTWTTKAGG